MKNPLTKKLIIIGAVVIVLLGAVLLVAFLPRSYTRPTLTDGDDIYYERLDENGDVLYSITKNEDFEQIKA
ncbi:MAG: hypothetical protein RBR66_04130, partial [Candidatus Izemoplasmatales bacterium]|nr:hypothetical protein [Candidatus Izemoplasmatales bacterium]